ncbi:hypothetical protein [Nakamurella antarctica]|uniref:hypothetical protein n=1 Tax=Nakamurella antarctica TaxID=1902245 RepID=UPI0013DE43B1|nr:hypothetical protein [Nakamurella antarctica]
MPLSAGYFAAIDSQVASPDAAVPEPLALVAALGASLEVALAPALAPALVAAAELELLLAAVVPAVSELLPHPATATNMLTISTDALAYFM